MFSIVVFDFDGTLVDSNVIKRDGFLRVAARHKNGTRRMEAVLARIAGDRHAVFEAYVADQPGTAHPGPADVEDLVQAYSEHVDAAVAAAPEMPGARLLLEQLREQAHKVYLSSATPLASLRSILLRRGWLHFFDDIFGYPASKVDVLWEILRLNRADVGSVAVIGDGDDDRASAAAVGCTFLPVGAPRRSQRVFTLPELSAVLLGRMESPAA